MNCSLLEDEKYFIDLKQKVAEWKAEGERVLPDKRCVWDWIKYNIRAHAILHSKKKLKKEMIERDGCKITMRKQQKYLKAIQVTSLRFALRKLKKNLNCFTKKKPKELSYGQGRAGMNVANVVQNTFSI